jgi:hypothetical protein
MGISSFTVNGVFVTGVSESPHEERKIYGRMKRIGRRIDLNSESPIGGFMIFWVWLMDYEINHKI